MDIKRIHIIIVMTLFTFCASAQNVKMSLGVTGGGIATQMLTEPAPSSPMYTSGYGGAFVTVNPLKKLGVRIGANYSMQGGNYQLDKVPITVSQSYVNIPVAVMFQPKSFFALEAGLYQNVLLNAKLNENGASKVEVNPDDGALKYNIGALVGVSLNLSKAIFVNIRYCYGLSYSYAIMGTGYKSNAITAGLGINLFRNKTRAFQTFSE